MEKSVKGAVGRTQLSLLHSTSPRKQSPCVSACDCESVCASAYCGGETKVKAIDCEGRTDLYSIDQQSKDS